MKKTAEDIKKKRIAFNYVYHCFGEIRNDFYSNIILPHVKDIQDLAEKKEIDIEFTHYVIGCLAMIQREVEGFITACAHVEE